MFFCMAFSFLAVFLASLELVVWICGLEVVRWVVSHLPLFPFARTNYGFNSPNHQSKPPIDRKLIIFPLKGLEAQPLGPIQGEFLFGGDVLWRLDRSQRQLRGPLSRGQYSAGKWADRTFLTQTLQIWL